jgi:hypothetical protein
MKDATQPTSPRPLPPAGRHPLWLFGLVVLVGYQGWLTLGLFDGGRDWRRLLDDDPIISGRHPLHLYHGYLGARSLVERGRLSCYDPAFHAGYPKTPVFDAGSRPAELALALAGGSYSPAAYKLGLAAFCLSIPVGLFAAARAAGQCRGVALLFTLLGQGVFWGRPGQEALEAGDVDLLLASLMLLLQAGMLVRYHRDAGVVSLGGVVLSGLVAWFAHPALSLLAVPLFLAYYLTVGHRHRPMWHLPLFVGLLLAVGGNAFWLSDLVEYWWIRVPFAGGTPDLQPRTLAGVWEAPLWGVGLDKALVGLLVLTGVAGVAVLHRAGQRPSARLFGLGAVGFLALAIAGTCSGPFARVGACRLLPPALLFAALPAAVTLSRLLDVARRWSGTVATPVLLAVSFPAVVALGAPGPAREWVSAVVAPRPLEVGLGEGRAALVEALRAATAGQARVLWEDRQAGRRGSHWTALLPLLTGRAFVGGLDADAGIEHAAAGLSGRRLAGRPVADWTDAELEAYCRKYNIGWVVCWSDEARERFGRWAGPGRALPGEGRPALFTLARESSYALAGSVRWVSADERGILLADAVPDQTGGQVVLSLHHQEGMRVRPARVTIERAVDPQDAIPFVRLRMSGPVGRIFITWEGR